VGPKQMRNLSCWLSGVMMAGGMALSGCHHAGQSSTSLSQAKDLPDPKTERLITGRHISPSAEEEETQNVGSHPANMITVLDGKFAISTDAGLSAGVSGRFAHRWQGRQQCFICQPARTMDRSYGLYYGLAATAEGKVYAAKGNHDSIAVFQVEADGNLTATQTINTRKSDFPAGLALDGKGFLYVANNDRSRRGCRLPCSMAITIRRPSPREVGAVSLH